MDKTARLIGEVAARYGIRLDPDDPAFALVALNQLVLEDAVEQVAGRMREIAAELESSAESVGLRAAVAVADQVRNARRDAPVDSPREPELANSAKHDVARWLAVGIVGSLLLFGLGLLVGARLL